MAPTPLTTTWNYFHRPFLLPLIFVLAGIRLASSQSIFTLQTTGATFDEALTLPVAAGRVHSGMLTF
jgi:hypothetical protein